MFALALLLATPDTIELRGALIAGHGPVPPASGILHTLLRLDVIDADGVRHAIYRTYLGPADIPRAGARCAVRFHIGNIGDGAIADAATPQRGKLLDSIDCE